MAAPTSTPTATAPSFLYRVQTRFVDSFLPDCIRQEYQRIIANLFTYKYAYIALATTILFAAAEYEQPGYFPRPQELTVGMIGGLFAFALFFSTYALMEYADDHTWFWNEEGFVWPWVGILWSLTVYNDETLSDSSTMHTVTSFPTSSPVASTTPAGSPARPDIIIPPTPMLPRGLRPVHLPLPPTHHSGILGESPMAPMFKHFSGNSGSDNVDEE
ncbi:hypothetical protein ACET3X_003372 [Alternaria dauci]|uniref:Uncharacterized protein n=1 Tax=Alternaria dauci TaxID=48095 RepID=A0ABR3US80_9PLEO